MKKITLLFIIAAILIVRDGVGQNWSIRNCIVNVTNANHFELTIGKLPIKETGKIKISLKSNDTSITIDSSRFINKPISFDHIYILSTSEKSRKIEDNVNEHPVSLYYYNSSNEKYSPYIDSLNKYNINKEFGRGKLKTEVAKNKHSLIIFIGKYEINYLKKFHTFFKNENIEYALINVDVKEKGKYGIFSVFQNNVFQNSINGYELNINDIESYFLSYKQLHCYFSCKTYSYAKQKLSDTLLISITSGLTYAIPFKIELKKRAIEPCINFADSLFQKQKYLEAFSYIQKNSKNINRDNIVNYYSKYYEKGLQYQYENNLPVTNYFNLSETNWKIDTITTINYLSLKKAYLKKVYLKLKKNNSDNQLKIGYLKKLVDLCPNSINYKIDLLNIRGDVACEKKDYSNAIDLYAKSYKLSNSEYRLKSIKNLLIKIAKNNCESSSRKKLWDNYKLFRSYYTFIEDNFALHFYAACTYYKLAFYDKAFIQYYWLKSHYQHDNTYQVSLVDLQEINTKLLDLQMKNCYYYEMSMASQASCYNANNPDSIKYYMVTYLESVKGIYFRSIIDAIHVYYKKNNSIIGLVNNLQKNGSQLLNSDIIESLFIFYPSTREQIMLKGTDKEDKNLKTNLKHLNSFPVTACNLSADSNLLFMVDKMGNSENSPLVVLTYKGISNNKAEQNLIYFLQNKKNRTSTWLEINKFEHRILEKYVSAWIAFTIQSHKIQSKQQLVKYWNKLNNHRHNIYIYLILYDNTGKELYNINFNKKDYIIDDLQWIKSTTTPLFFKQVIKEKSNSTITISDVSLPIHNSISNSVLKIGIKQP